MTRARSIVAAAFCAAVSGCALTGEPYERPELAAPGAWQGRAEGAQAGAWPDRAWWQRFGLAELDEIISLAQSSNRDLRAAAARVAQARAALRIAGAGLYPQVDLNANVTRSKVSGQNAQSTYSLGGLASYELDLWGRNRFTRDASDAALLASRFDYETVRITLTADVANAYFQLLSLNDRIRVAQENLANARRLLELVEVQRSVGRVSGFELERQRSQVASTEAAIPPLVQQRQATRDALAVLLGRHASAFGVKGESLRPVVLPPAVLGVPSQLVERRPDIRRAEASLMAANANIGAARAALFPSVTLSATGGWVSASASGLFSPGTGFLALGLDVLLSIFDGGRQQGQVDLAAARQAELAETYLQTIVLAFRDVEDALAGIEQFSLQEQQQEEAVRHAREAYRIAEERYRAGATDFTTVLDAQRTLLAAEAALDPVRLARFSSLVALYRALGGGWDGSTAGSDSLQIGMGSS